MNAIHGFMGMLARLIGDWKPAGLACAIDVDWRPQWRIDLIPGYKAHRAEDPSQSSGGDATAWAEPGLDVQVPLMYRLLEGFGLALVGKEGYEAEDIIGTLAQRVRGPVLIVSGDRDLFQLVRDPDVQVLYPRRGVAQVEVIDEAAIEDRFDIPPHAYLDYAVLRGDASDGLPGVRGVGEKTASTLLRRHGSLEAVIAASLEEQAPAGALGKVRGALDYLDKAVRVVSIVCDIDLGPVELDLPRGEPSSSVMAEAEAHSLGGAARRLTAALAAAGGEQVSG